MTISFSLGAATFYREIYIPEAKGMCPDESKLDFQETRPSQMPYNLTKELPGTFLGGPVVKNPPANGGDMGSIPGPGRFHGQQGN